MPRKIFTPEQIIRKLREAEVLIAKGLATQQAARQIGVSKQTYYRWRRKYGRMQVEQAKRLQVLEKENTRLKRLWRREGLKVPQRQSKRRWLWLNDGSCIRLTQVCE